MVTVFEAVEDEVDEREERVELVNFTFPISKVDDAEVVSTTCDPVDFSSESVDDFLLGVVTSTGVSVDFSSAGVDDSLLVVVSTIGVSVDFSSEGVDDS